MTTTYNARDLVIDVAADEAAWDQIDEPTRLVAAVQPLAEVARIVGDRTMHQNLRLVAALHDVNHDVEWQPAEDQPELSTPMLMQQVVPLLREAGQTRDPAPLGKLAFAESDLAALARCSHLLAAAALAIGSLRLCRLYVLAARTVDGAQAR